MSLALAEHWVKSFVRIPQAVERIRSILAQAGAQEVDATILAAPELMVDLRGRLVRWTGDELLVLEVTPEQLADFNMTPGQLSCYLGFPASVRRLPTRQALTLSGLWFHDEESATGNRPLSGHFDYQFNDRNTVFEGLPILHLDYFHPAMPHASTVYWHPSGPLLPPRGRLEFQVAALTQQQPLTGPVAVFTHLVTPKSPSQIEPLRRVSNAVGRIVGRA